MKKTHLLARLGLLLSCAGIIIGLALEACAPPPATNNTVPTFTIGGAASGLNSGQSAVLQNNGKDNLILDSDGDFEFDQMISEGNPYNVTVFTQPTGQNCVVAHGTGTASADVTNVTVTCSNVYTVGGMVEGLQNGSSVVLQNNEGDNLTVNGQTEQASDFTFPTALADGATYSVTVLSVQPTTEQCQVFLGTGTISAANVTNVEVSCFPAP